MPAPLLFCSLLWSGSEGIVSLLRIYRIEKEGFAKKRLHGMSSENNFYALGVITILRLSLELKFGHVLKG